MNKKRQIVIKRGAMTEIFPKKKHKFEKNEFEWFWPINLIKTTIAEH